MLGSFLSKVFLLHIPYWIRFCLFSSSFFFFIWGVSYTSHWIYFSVGSFSYTSRAGFFFSFFFSFFLFIWGVSLTHPILNLPFCGEFTHPLQTSFLCGEFLLYIPICLHFYPERFSYRSCVSSFFLSLFLFLSWEFLLHIPCWVHFYRGSFSYTSRAGFIFIWGVSLTHPVLAAFLFIFYFYFLSGEFLLHIPCWIYFFVGSFSYTSRARFVFFFFFWGVSLPHRAGFIFIGGVSLTHPVLASFLYWEFPLHIPCWIFFFLSVEFLLHIPYWIYFSVVSFCYTSRAGFFFFFFLIWGVSLTHPMLDLFFCGCFSYTSIADFVFMWGVSLTHPVLPSFLSWEILFVPFYFIFIFLSGEFLLLV